MSTTDQDHDQERYRCADGHDCVIPADATDQDRALLAADIATGALSIWDAHCSNVHLIITARPVGNSRTRLARTITVTGDRSLCTLCD